VFGVVVVEDLVFGARTSVVVDPAEVRLKAEFEAVKRTFVPLHAIIRIDEVEKQGVSKIHPYDGDNVSQFPIPVYTPGGSGGSGDS